MDNLNASFLKCASCGKVFQSTIDGGCPSCNSTNFHLYIQKTPLRVFGSDTMDMFDGTPDKPPGGNNADL